MWEGAAEGIEKADVAAEQFARLLSVDVGHTESEVVYAENKLELHHYEPDEQRHETPIFIVYALVNRPYILDLQPDRSVIRFLLDEGFEVYLVDWGEPSTLDQALTLEDYVCRYMANCADAVREHSGADDLHLFGYCMGGSLSIMYAQRHPEDLRTLTLLATPLAFDGHGGILERWASHYDPDTTVEAMGNLPAELLAVEFSMMDPVEQFISKYVTLYENLENDAFVENFGRMEQWIWDGVDVAGEAYRQFVNDVYKDNQLIEGEFDLAGEPVELSDIELPVLQIVGEYDHIVPAASSKPFNERISSDDERIIEFPVGHIGISVSSKSHELLWPEVTDWLAERDAGTDGEDALEERDDVAADEADDAGAEETPAAAEATEAHVEAMDDAAEVNGDAQAANQAVQAVAQKAAQQVQDVQAAEAGEAPGVDAIDGIGPTYADRLRDAGIETTADLRDYEAAELAEIAETSPSRTTDWLKRAN
ncbi:class III poly(R)-hydroxyalkanoic acid synthase subunit PhaC [Halobacteriales archaeon Cl-PHB]